MKKFEFAILALLISINSIQGADPSHDCEVISGCTNATSDLIETSQVPPECSQFSDIINCEQNGCIWNGLNGKCKSVNHDAGYCSSCYYIGMQSYGVNSFTYWYGYNVFNAGSPPVFEQGMQAPGQPSKAMARQVCEEERARDKRCGQNDEAGSFDIYSHDGLRPYPSHRRPPIDPSHPPISSASCWDGQYHEERCYLPWVARCSGAGTTKCCCQCLFRGQGNGIPACG